VFIERRRRICEVVVSTDHPVVRHVHGVVATGECQDAAVVAVGEDQDLATARVVRGSRQRHEVGLGAGVREADLLHCVESSNQQLGESHLVDMDRTERPAVVERLADGVEDGFGTMAQKAGRVVAEEIDIAMSVDIVQLPSCRLSHTEREWSEVENGTGVSSRLNGARPIGPVSAQRPLLRIVTASYCDGVVQVHLG
jgi:hypothetical protein